MKRDKWKDFEMSGKIEDYLSYKGLSLYGYNDSESGMINADNRQGIVIRERTVGKQASLLMS